MIILDLNLLIYGVNADTPQHKEAKNVVENCFSGSETVGLTWGVVLGFIRITTQARIMPAPLSCANALRLVDHWLNCSAVQIVQPGLQHWTILKELLGESGAAANLTSDAHLAAITIEQGAKLYTTDNDFARFPGLRWANPLLRGQA